MSDQDYWEQFVRTGNISDYLNYTACTREDKYGQVTNIKQEEMYGKMTGSIKEGEPRSGDYNSDRYGPEGDAIR